MKEDSLEGPDLQQDNTLEPFRISMGNLLNPGPEPICWEAARKQLLGAHGNRPYAKFIAPLRYLGHLPSKKAICMATEAGYVKVWVREALETLILKSLGYSEDDGYRILFNGEWVHPRGEGGQGPV